MTDLFVVNDTRGPDDGVVVWADSAPEAAVAAVSKLPVPYMFSDGVQPPRRLSVYRAEKIGEFEIGAQEVPNG